MTCHRLGSVLVLTLCFASAAAARSQPAPDAGPVGALEFSAGYAGFVDDATIGHAIFGAGTRWYVGRRLSIGPEVVYMREPRAERNLYLTGNLTWDLLGNRGRPARIVPFVVAGAGMMRHSDRFGDQAFSSTEGAFTAGGGVRAWLNDRIFVAGDARLGWEPHYRLAGTVGVKLGR